jgi:peptide/nickel transport system permease protein
MPVSDSRKVSMKKETTSGRGEVLPKKSWGLYSSLREFTRFPAAVVGVLIILALIGVSIYAVITIPYKEAIARWGPEATGKEVIPKNAQPVWVNWFRKDPLPPTIILNSADGTATHGTISKVFTPGKNGATVEVITYTIDFTYGGFPQDMVITFDGQYEKKPFVNLTWQTPDGREFELGNFSAVSRQRYIASQDIPGKYLDDQIFLTQGFFGGSGGSAPVEVLFMHPDEIKPTAPLNGTYTLRIDAFLFDEGANLDAEIIFYGQVYGLGGTDDYRRDLMVALLWGTPIALAFGLLGAISTGALSMIIAAIGVWFGGWVDSVIQRLTEVNMILPTLPLAITIYYLYSKSIWMILGVLILLSIFGSAIKTYRAAFLQVKELPYIEAAQAYGASNWRIIRHYLVPRIIPLLIPQLVILVPSYVFFEATLAYLQVSDPKLPTWGKVVYDALTRGAFNGDYYWVLEPVALMILTALAFAVVGFALDSILNPRLRRI